MSTGAPPDSSSPRPLGVVESFTVVRDQCPNGAVRAVAESALEAIKSGGAPALSEQALNVLVAIQGWRSDRARQVHAALTEFLEGAEKD